MNLAENRIFLWDGKYCTPLQCSYFTMNGKPMLLLPIKFGILLKCKPRALCANWTIFFVFFNCIHINPIAIANSFPLVYMHVYRIQIYHFIYVSYAIDDDVNTRPVPMSSFAFISDRWSDKQLSIHTNACSLAAIMAFEIGFLGIRPLQRFFHYYYCCCH